MATGVVYLTLAEFAARTIVATSQINALALARPGFIERSISEQSRRLESRLNKRYKTPWPVQLPEEVIRWLVVLTTKQVLLALGTNANDEQVIEIWKQAEEIDLLVKESADEENGLIDLPLRDDQNGSAIVEEAPLACSQTSPYDWIDVEANRLDRQTVR